MMSRIAKMPVSVPADVQIMIAHDQISVKGPRGELHMCIHALVDVVQENGAVLVRSKGSSAGEAAQAGTTRSLIANMIKGVCEGFEKELQLVGVGYRAQMQGRVLNLSLGYSHPIEYRCPRDVDIEMPSQTRIIVRGSDKQRVGQTAAEIRAYRPPEPYKGKGVRYAGENIFRKEAKKKQ